MGAEVEQIQRAMMKAAGAALLVTANDLEGRAARDAPVETGELRGSGTVDVSYRPGEVEAIVAFTAPHAAVQEVREDFNHPRGGKARYLGDQFSAMLPRYERAVQAAVAKVFR